jgi:hypothetical protein
MYKDLIYLRTKALNVQSHILISIRLYFILTILITEDDHDWLYAACLEYFIFFSINSVIYISSFYYRLCKKKKTS